ncbi:MAG: tetratricopeptide repeat protein, partial [Flavobacterium sp.]
MKQLLFTFAFLCCTLTYSQTTDYTFVYQNDSILQKGIRLYDKGQYKEAEEEYNKISKIDPKFLNAQYEKSMALSAQGTGDSELAKQKKDELRKLYEDLYSTGRFPDLPMLYTTYGSFLSDQKEYDKSEKIFKEGEKYLAHSGNFLYNFALLYIRMDQRQKSIDLLERVVTENPNMPSAHYLLGLLALEDGRIAEGTMAIMTYLMVAPTGHYAEEAVIKLNAKFGQNYLDKSKYTFTKSGDDFSELETILRNQLPLRPAYKVKSDFDDIIIRQVQAVVDYSAEHKMGNGFFETTYMPWIKRLSEKNQFEGMSYYILLSLEQKLGKKITSKKKKISEFYTDFVQNEFWDYVARRKMEHFGKVKDVTIIFKNNMPFLIGDISSGKKEGKFKMLNDDGNLDGELNFANDMGTGLQKYYNEKGEVNMEKNFKDNMLDGPRKTYYENGMLSVIENYKADKLNGLSTSYHVNGAKQCEINFTDGERDGKLTCVYANGTKKSESTFVKGKMNGPFAYYNEAGDVTESGTYANDELTGAYKEFYDGKVLKAEAIYADGKIQGSYKRYYPNNTLEQENVYVNGKLSKAIAYYATGKISTETLYNDKGEMESYAYYDADGNKYYEEKYRGGKLSSGVQYTSKSAKPIELSIAKKPFSIKNFDSTDRVVGEFEKGVKNKEWKYYFSSGQMRLKEMYKQGLQNGLTYSYNRNGSLNSVSNFVNDSLSGQYEGFDSGKRDRLFSYVAGHQTGPYKAFYPDGTVSAEGYLIDGDVSYTKYNYWQNGTVSRIDKYIEDELILSEFYTPKGEKESTLDFKNKTGKFTESRFGNVITQTFNMVNGAYNGKFEEKDKTGTMVADADFVNNVRHNNYKSFSPSGQIFNDINYYCGKKNGVEKSYDLLGNLRIYQEYLFGDEFGKTIRYYQNKNKLAEYNYLDGDLEGDYTYFNQKGEAVVKLFYVGDCLKYYMRKDKNGELTEKVPVTLETAEIVSNYPNGKPAIKYNMIKGSIDGTFTIFGEDGKTNYEAQYKNG